MVDFGLVALVVVLLIMMGGCAWVFAGIKTEMTGIRKVEHRIDASYQLAEEAKAGLSALNTTQYQKLAEKLESYQDDLRTLRKLMAEVEDTLSSHKGQLAALKRWRVPPAPAEPQGPAEPASEIDSILRDAGITLPPENPPQGRSSFGKKIK